ncbi:MAG: hypothetical protein LBD42_00185 [Desulfovibrio sp.]|jgi:hypothetical protein|nr:hypothetical protein [Desulfovibrio sp.]
MPTHPHIRRPASLLLVILVTGLLFSGCSSTPKQPPIPVGSLKLGVADFTQPNTASDMLAGYAHENSPHIDKKVLNAMDAVLASVLADKSQNSFRSKESAQRCLQLVHRRTNKKNKQSALRTWAAIGRCMGVDLLIVPQLYVWRERDGGSFGVVTPARVVMDIFVLDVRNESLISRSHFDETQSALTGNLFEADKFFKRSAKWISANDLAREGMEKAVKELGL